MAGTMDGAQILLRSYLIKTESAGPSLNRNGNGEPALPTKKQEDRRANHPNHANKRE
jgi:hypothetical protein